MEVKLWEIVRAAGGRLLQGDGGACISSFITDSREAGPGAMFVPIRGERTDGHAYVGAASPARAGRGAYRFGAGAGLPPGHAAGGGLVPGAV